MPNLKKLSLTSMSGLVVSSHSMCSAVAIKLNAEQTKIIKTTRIPEEIVAAVKNSVTDLTMNERKALPNLLLLPAYEKYQSEFAMLVFKNFSSQRNFWRRLFRSWLLEYNLSSPVAAMVINELKKNIGKLSPDFQKIASKYPILEITPNFHNTAKSLLDGEMPNEDRLSLGLSDLGNILTGPAEEIFISCIALLRSSEPNEFRVQNFIRLVAPSGVIHKSTKMYAMVGLILGVESYASGAEIVKKVSSLVNKNFDDPVTENIFWPSVTNRLGGSETRERCLSVARKWRVFRSITLFFNIIDQVVDSEHKHHFPMRKSFWLNYFDKGEVTDAWIILGAKARDKIAQLKNTNPDEFASLSWGSLSGGPVDQCAILLKLNQVTVMEFSHSGRARIWGQRGSSSQRIPDLYRPRYETSELRAECPESQMFRHDPNGRWRIQAQTCIQKLSGRSFKL